MNILATPIASQTKPCTAARCRRKPCGLALGIDLSALDGLMPMHAILAKSGEILHAGPTLKKLRANHALIGAAFSSLFDLRRPRGITSVEDLAGCGESQIRVVLRDAERTPLKGQVVPLACRRALLINLSFGIEVVEAVRRFDLTSIDFAGTDLAVEMLFLVEAHSAALTESKRLNGRLQSARLAAEQEAATDKLTGLKNRRAMEHVLARLIGQGTPFGLMHLDLDHFKQINDTYGHAAGDEVLRATAERLRGAMREGDSVARIGGDEFVLVFHGLANPHRLSEIAGRIVASLDAPVPYGAHMLALSGSLGVTATGLYNAPDADTMLEDADAALYAAKRAGRGRFHLVEDKGE